MIINLGSSKKFNVKPITDEKWNDETLICYVNIDLCWRGAPDEIFYFRVWAVNETDAEQFACGEKGAWETALSAMLRKAETYWNENEMYYTYGSFPKEQFREVGREFFKGIRSVNGKFVAYSDKAVSENEQTPEEQKV